MEVLTVATVDGPNELRCQSPRVVVHGRQPTPLELILNGDRETKTSEGTNFTFYGQPGAEVMVSSISPLGSPVAGGTRLTLHGDGFLDLGDSRVRLGKFGTIEASVGGGGSNVSLVTPPARAPAAEELAVSADGATFVRSGFKLTIFDIRSVHLSRLEPWGGPSSGGTRVTVHGTGLASLPASCILRAAAHGETATLVPATVVNTSLAVCVTPHIDEFSDGGISASGTGLDVRLDLTINGELGTRHRTYDGLHVYMYNASAVRVDSVAPRGGPTNGGTEVVVRGAGFADVGGVFCRFGGNVSAVVAATVRSTSELVCMSPQLWEPSPHLLADDLEYVLVDAAAACCPDPDGYSGRLGSTPNGSAPTPSSCEVGCTALDDCRFFSHSSETASCEFCAECAFDRSTLGSMRSVWHRRGLPRADVRLGLILNGPGATLSPPAALAPTFTYYWPRLLEVSHVVPSGGPVAGGTEVTFFGSGFGSPLGSPLCSFGWLEPSTNATIADDGGSLRCASPPQPDVNYSLVNVGSLTGGSALPPVPRQGIAHQYTADGCASTGTPHQSRCTRRQDLAAFSCCEHDGSRCQAMCLSPVTGLMYSDISPGGQVASAVSYVHAARACDELMMRLCA